MGFQKIAVVNQKYDFISQNAIIKITVIVRIIIIIYGSTEQSQEGRSQEGCNWELPQGVFLKDSSTAELVSVVALHIRNPVWMWSVILGILKCFLVILGNSLFYSLNFLTKLF